MSFYRSNSAVATCEAARSKDPCSGRCSTKHGRRRTRVKSTPLSSNVSSCSLSSVEPTSRLGHFYFPRSKRLYQIASPVRSQMVAFTRSERLPQNRKRSPPIGFASSVSVMMAQRPEKLRRVSTGATVMKIRVPGGGAASASKASQLAHQRQQGGRCAFKRQGHAVGQGTAP